MQKGVRANAAAWLATIVLGAVAISLAALPGLERTFLLRDGERSEATLRLAVEGLRGALRRHEPLPTLIAERPILRTFLNNPGDVALKAEINEQLRQSAIALQASDVYLMDVTGLTIAASSYLKKLSFVGRSFHYRPYFTQALAGGLGRFFALGTTSGERGYFFAAPVVEQDTVIGVVTVKFTVDEFEALWSEGDGEIIVSDLDGIIFMSTRPDWHFRAFSTLTDQMLDRIAEARQYPLDRVTELRNNRTPLSDRISLITVDDAGASTEFVSSTMAIPDAGWQVTILSPTGAAKTQALAVLALVAMVIVSAAMIAAIALQRRARLAERFEAQRTTQELLEKRVAERTGDLNTANSKLVDEIEERKATEAQLRKTQADLVQAGKLAALGQMSAALSHEFNQPLAAVKVYADNATQFLDRARIDEARDNVKRISQMTDRMAAISNHLRNFARRPQQKIGPVPLVAVVDDAIDLMEARLKTTSAKIAFDRPDQEIWVIGGHVRLQQVMVNLLSNALDAMESNPAPIVEISIAGDGDRCAIKVRDHGDGLHGDQKAQIFDPFFTTKSPGKGLGLGLSISYNIIKDFGGHLSATNHAETGAIFIVDLKRVESLSHAEPATRSVAAE
ncbi:MAG: sensor histidine kinase [Roseitalea sp.]|jgi:two-component system C4-dicarboxylate transport sensor histidine kinase DctB|nr:sensor histidine kinase [Roseitalea sp.]MBO6720261.1 sensor histidine kinase [Roseitalea sp.]MBO6742621.1 sensor histidine kinase [Roseitalea sp.]